MREQYEKIIDISMPLCADTVIYPGDPMPEYELIFSLKTGGVANVGGMKHGLHHGTHIDVPYHFFDEGKRLDEMPLSTWIGPALVVDATQEEKCISADTLRDVPLEKYDKILFKTKNSAVYYDRPGFVPEFIYLDKSACELMAEKGVKTVGLDYITVDPFGGELAAHVVLLGKDVCIIECINLKAVDPGEYYLMCLPLKLIGTDGANARAVLLQPGFTV